MMKSGDWSYPATSNIAHAALFPAAVRTISNSKAEMFLEFSQLLGTQYWARSIGA